MYVDKSNTIEALQNNKNARKSVAKLDLLNEPSGTEPWKYLHVVSFKMLMAKVSYQFQSNECKMQMECFIQFRIKL